MNTLREELLFPIHAGNRVLRADQLRTRLKMYPTMVVGQALLTLILWWMMRNVLSHDSLLTWMGAIYLFLVIDILHWASKRNRLGTIEECVYWHRAFVGFTLVCGLIWGSLPIWLFPSDYTHQILLVALMMGLVAGSVATNPAYPVTLHIFAFCALLPLIVRFVVEDGEWQRTLACLLALFLAIMHKAGAEIGRALKSAFQHRYENQALIGELIAQKDMADQARLQAESANREKSRFLAAASHDLRQPLQALTLFSDALLGVAREKETAKLALQIERSVSALGEMFNELLDLSRLETGVLQPRLQHFHVSTMLDRIYIGFAPLAQSKALGFDLSVDGPEGDAVIYSDPFLLERILRNLLTNAFSYTETGTVMLRCKPLGRELEIEVRDTGIGIHPDILPHIFEEYFQASNPNRDRRKGLGLGLAIVRRIERMLGYEISVRTSMGAGTVFSFRVPLGDASQADTPLIDGSPAIDLNGVVVALVEDDQDIRQMAERVMKRWGCLAFSGEMPEEVVEKMEAAGLKPGLLVCDYRLPQGVTAISVFRKMHGHWGAGIPALVLTGETDPEVMREIQDYGAMLLHKPVTPGRLRAMMHLAVYGEG